MTEDRAAQLRREFDGGFQAEAKTAHAKTIDLLVIRLGDRDYGMKVEGVEAVVKGKRVTALPGSAPDFMGIAGFRGALVGVYDLASWLGLKRKSGEWLLLVRTGQSQRVALVFDSLEGQLRLEEAEFLTAESSEFVKSHVQLESRVLPVLSLPSLLERFAEARPVQ